MSSSRLRTVLAPSLLAVALVVSTYVIGWFRASRVEVDRAEARLAEVSKDRPSPADVDDAVAVLTAARAEIAKAGDRVDALERRAAPPSPGPDAGAALQAILRDHSLVLDRDRPAASGDMILVPGPWRSTPAAASRLRLLDVTGRYLDVVGAVRALAAPGAPAVPLRLEMRPGAVPSARPTWTFTLWI